MELNLGNLLYDAAYLVIFLGCVIFAAHRGAFRAVAGIGGTIGGAICGSMFNAPVAARIAAWLSPLLTKQVGKSTAPVLAERILALDVPDALRALADQAAAAAGAAEEAARAEMAQQLAAFLSEKVAPLLAFVAIFLAVKLAVSLVCSLLSLDIPILSTLNEWAGALIGAVSGALILVVLTWAVWHFSPGLGVPALSREALQSSYIGGLLCRLFT